jgi:hypothetical protein
VTQAEFARHLDAEPATVSRRESGTQRADVRAELLLRTLLALMRTSPVTIYRLDTRRPPQAFRCCSGIPRCFRTGWTKSPSPLRHGLRGRWPGSPPSGMF